MVGRQGRPPGGRGRRGRPGWTSPATSDCPTAPRCGWTAGPAGPGSRATSTGWRSSTTSRSSSARWRWSPTPVEPRADLAADQLAAVAHLSGPARVIAPAGSGKTRVLTERLRHLLGDRGYEREAVLAVAYNKQAQLELQSRTEAFQPRVRTLNSLGLWILGEYHGRLPPTIDEREVRSIVEKVAPVRRQRRANTDPIGPYVEALSEVRLGLVSPAEIERERDDVPGLHRGFRRVPTHAGRAWRGRLRRPDLRRDRAAAGRRGVPAGDAAPDPPPPRRRVPGPHPGPRPARPAARPPGPRRVRGRRRRPDHLRARVGEPRLPHPLRPRSSPARRRTRSRSTTAARSRSWTAPARCWATTTSGW